jgi:hypothetical protein
VRLAYADPPYLGQAKRHYAHDPSGIEAAEVDFPALIDRLRTYDGWAMSASSPSLGHMLNLAPEARVAPWCKPWCIWKPSNRVQYAWEPVLFVAAPLARLRDFARQERRSPAAQAIVLIEHGVSRRAVTQAGIGPIRDDEEGIQGTTADASVVPEGEGTTSASKRARP